ncbi:apolipoprotein N-acyltransferase [Desulfurispira natronophila]|uniref:Apolipoprotein N-acyltransferase n=1 Tax=Desulfurispira natronophila TaxID=682562 RepID=A0A7W7Y4B1_9BACT|nr:apolipoprotein N-acyltransferase [Desulfurispira natronophila]MBB5021830.1 apolipoprotein N-acyltransferase [Desulfurispira natronophila]
MLSFFFAIISALLLIAAFEPLGYSWLAWFALVPLLVGVQLSKRPFWTGFAWGLVFFVASLHWIPHIFTTYALSHQYLGVPATALLAAYLAVFPGIFAWGIKRLLENNHHSTWTALRVASLFIALEFVRAHLFTGFPWNLIGYSVLDFEYISQILRLVGVYGLGFVVLVVNYVIYVVLFKSFQRNIAYLLVSCGAMLGLSIFYSAWVIGVEESYEYDRISVRAVQANVDQFQKWDEEYAETNLNRHIDLSLADDFGPGLLIWPESALPFFYSSDHPGKERVHELARSMGVSLLTGTLFFDRMNDDIRYYNSAAIISDEGELQDRYDKIQLVPFGEYTPLKETLLPFVEKFVQGEDYSRGTQRRSLETDFGLAGTFICFESIFPELVAGISADADFLVNITNDAWFGDTWAPYQHLAMARARAMENGKFMVRSSNSGITAVYDQFGRMVDRIDLHAVDAITVEIEVIPRITLFNRYPYAFAFFTIGITLFSLVESLRTRRKQRRVVL